MLSVSMWTSFEHGLSVKDVSDIEKRLTFLREVIEDADRQFEVEDVSSELDLNLHIYLAYFQNAGNERLSGWQIHDAWLYYYSKGECLTVELKDGLTKAYMQPANNLRAEIAIFLECLGLVSLIRVEADAVIWLSFLDHLASRLIYHIGLKRMKSIFG